MHAHFFDYHVDLPENVNCISTAWSETESTLAVALKSKEIIFFHEEGDAIPLVCYSRNSLVSLMKWQPRGKCLSVGWMDGMVSTWNMDGQFSRETNSPHKAPICLLKWSPGGNRLITADDNGLLVVWKADIRGQLTIACQYRRQGVLNHLVFYTSPEQRQRQIASDTFTQQICPSFFCTGEQGTVHYADDLGHITDVLHLQVAVASMAFYEERKRLVIITRSLAMMQLQVADDGKIKPISKTKVSVASDDGIGRAIWVAPGLLATASNENLVRFWDLGNDANYVISLNSISQLLQKDRQIDRQIDRVTDRVTCIDFNPQKRILAAGTKEGKVLFWKFVGLHNDDPTTAENWELISPVTVGSEKQLENVTIRKIEWSKYQSMLVVETDTHVWVLNQEILSHSLSGSLAAIQTSKKTIYLENLKLDKKKYTTLTTGIIIKGIAHYNESLVVWNGKKVEVYDNSFQQAKPIASYHSQAVAFAMDKDSLYRAIGKQLEICNFQGVVKHTLFFTEIEGEPRLLDLNGKFLAVATDRGLIKILEISRKDPKIIGCPGILSESNVPGLNGAVVKSIKCSSDGARICFTVENIKGSFGARIPDTRIHIYHAELKTFASFEFGPLRYPISVFWDSNDGRLLACETGLNGTMMKEKLQKMKEEKKDRQKEFDTTGYQNGISAENEVTTLFVTLDYGIRMQDSFKLDRFYEVLLGVSVPNLYFVGKAQEGNRLGEEQTSTSLLKTRVMRDFLGLDAVDDSTKAALIDFSYFITIGNMDEAYRSVKLVQNPSVWENMAHMCVKTKRLDVAEVCLGNMGHARGARAVREAKKEPELDARIAMVAIQLGLLDDAARLYRECNRFDLLNKLYQAAGYWEKAIELASEKDRINLRTSYYSYAREMEVNDEIRNAMKYYKLAAKHQKEVPRMLFHRAAWDTLEEFVDESDDPNVYIWWAQYLESKQRFKEALHYYKTARDYLSMVRVHCYNNDFETASEIVCSTNDRAAAYHLARQFEIADSVSNAIHFFSQAGCYNHCIRLAKANGLDSELMNFALLSTPAHMIDCAMYFEKMNEYEKAVQLYQKGGCVSKALDLCFRGQLYDILHQIADDLGEDTSPQMLLKCSEFFMQNEQYVKAAHLLIIGKKYNEALDICIRHNVKITEEIAEKLTIPKTDDPKENKQRVGLLLKLAKICKQQGSFHLATKKYTQGGDKLKAMKCLLKSGDTEKVVFFAGVSRTKEIYTIAGNYLQNLDWHNDPEIMKHIIGFYSKAAAYEQLASFYDACAQVEIDNYRDYEKAAVALKEAVKHLSKVKSESKENNMRIFQQRIYFIEQFVAARRLLKSDPKEMISLIQQLLEQPEIEQAIRVGDAFAQLIEFFYEEGNMEQAYKLLVKMRERRISEKMYLQEDMVDNIRRAVGIPTDNHVKSSKKMESEVEMEEDLEEEIEDEGKPSVQGKEYK